MSSFSSTLSSERVGGNGEQGESVRFDARRTTRTRRFYRSCRRGNGDSTCGTHISGRVCTANTASLRLLVRIKAHICTHMHAYTRMPVYLKITPHAQPIFCLLHVCVCIRSLACCAARANNRNECVYIELRLCGGTVRMRTVPQYLLADKRARRAHNTK